MQTDIATATALDQTMRPETVRMLTDARTGMIRHLTRTPLPKHFPLPVRQYTTAIADTTRFAPWAADTAGAGTAFWDDEGAIAAAVGESVERYCANLVPDGLREASYAELTAAGELAIDPDTLALYSPSQYATSGFPFVPFTRDLTVRWVQGRRLLSHEPIWVPAPLVWITYFEGARTEAPTNALVHAGVAAGSTRAHADWSALTELVERDAMTLAWTGRRCLYLAEPPPWLARMAAGPHGRLHTRFVVFPSDFGVPALGALMVDRETGYTCMGTACRTDLEQAMLKALAEAVQMQLIIAKLDDPDGPFAAIAPTPGSPLKPWRADRAYLRDYRSDRRDYTHHACHLQAYLDPAMGELLDAELADVETVPVSALEDPDGPHGVTHPVSGDTVEQRLAVLGGRLEAAGHPVCSINLTTDDIAPTGLRVTRVTAPGLYSYAAAAFPCLGGRRLPALLTVPDDPGSDSPGLPSAGIDSSDSGARCVPLPH